MSKKKNRPFYSFLDRIEKGTKEDYFYDPKDFSWSRELEEKFPIIKKEIIDYMQSGNASIKPYYATDMMNEPGKWKTFSFYFWGMRASEKAIEACPETVQAFLNVPGISSFSVSILEPNSEIKGHRGDTDAIYRCHLGIIVPSSLPYCGFYVGYEERSWEEGKLLIFNDAAYHKGWNRTDGIRIVVLFDVIREPYLKQKKWVSSRIWGALIFSMLNEKYLKIKKSDSLYRKVLSYIFAFPVYWVFLFRLRKTIFDGSRK